MAMRALGPQAPQAKFFLVEGCDVGGEEVELPGRKVSTNRRWAIRLAWKIAYRGP